MCEQSSLIVHVSATESPSDTPHIRRLLEGAGFRVEFDNRFGIGGGLPEVAFWILVITPATKFLNEIAAGTARHLLEEIWKSRRSSSGAQGYVAIADHHYLPEAKFSAEIPAGLPETAYTDLQVLAKKLKRGKVKFDVTEGGWVVDDRELRSQIEHLNVERLSFLRQLQTPWWRIWRQ